MDPLQTVAATTERGFAWLCRDIPPDEPVTFVPNPGNIGDALINLSCHRYLAARFASVSVCSINDSPPTDCVFIGGGGNLVEGLYSAISDFVTNRCAGHRLFFFPSSVQGFDHWLDGLPPDTRMVCREPLSFAHVADHMADDRVLLGHDAAFGSAGWLRAAFAEPIRRHPSTMARFFRTDGELAHGLPGDEDIMARTGGTWTDPKETERAVTDVAMTLLNFGRIYSDRLHCAILAAMLDRYVVLVPNSYFKNRAVFDHSLSSFANVRFESERLAFRVAG